MNSLRVKFALILITAIICVVGLATVISVVVLNFNHSRHMPRLAAEQIMIIHALARSADRLPAGIVLPAPPPGPSDAGLEGMIREGLDTLGSHPRVVVTRREHDEFPRAFVEIADGQWVGIPVLDRPPTRDGWFIISGWMLLIAVGTVGVAIVVANRVTRPLSLLEDAALAAAASGGSLSQLPETGPAEIRTTARAINRLSRSLRSAMEGRMRMVAAAGHDLRTPMTRMRLRAEFLSDAEREVWLRDLDELERIADSAIRLVRETTDASRNEDVPLDVLVGEIASELKGLDLKIEVAALEPVVISANPLALTRALRNLLTNAATHGGGGVVTLSRRGDEALLAIEDHGPGIPSELMDRVFEPFFRADPARRQAIPGAGLGLAIAKEIVARHSGTIELANRAGGGLCQTLRFAAVG